ncbi:glycoside hydrolase family 19 protein [Mesorhizobium sp. BE184]|uniref:glycoside hydrolase family 19 protein n=1 Tax=Mesorhizobium sp. BE184 TaxID=2817714 RepID=UPI00285AD456|nr:glycoside hydrolase family 19 protein [Mesorhizobium sp. BE184]MDR7032442.1 putative chitinase [Mesorhizobium sp. BE184]
MTNVPPGAPLSLALVQKIVGKKLTAKQKANADSMVTAVNTYSDTLDLYQPHRLAQYLAQLLHESGSFNFDRELWGPTAAQKRYEGRKDLGNTVKGDGSKYRGRGPIQITGRANYREFTKWARKIASNAPDFEANPDAVNTDPWEGLGPIWYWDTHDLNRYADQGDIETITKKINGGLNGFDDRVNWYARSALALLGLDPGDLKAFQKKAKEAVDGVPGPRTRAALHRALVDLTAPVLQAPEVQAAPVVVETEKQVVPKKVETEVKQKTNWLTYIFGTGGLGAGLVAFLRDADWQTIGMIIAGGVVAGGLSLAAGIWIVRRIKAIRKEWETA